jgi:hypothetical protein
MSLWKELKIEEKIRKILVEESKPYRKDKENHSFGYSFLSIYQIAILFKEKYPEDFETIGKAVGGKGEGKGNSIAMYISGELSRRIGKEIKDIEGGFISYKYMDGPAFIGKDGERIESSAPHSGNELTVFRKI